MGYETSVRGFHDHDHDHGFRDHGDRDHGDHGDHGDRDHGYNYAFHGHNHAFQDQDHGFHGYNYVLNYDNPTPWATSQNLADKINASIANGSLITVPPDTDPQLPKGVIGEFVQTHDGKTQLPTGYNVVVDVATNAIIRGSGGQDQSILVGGGNLSFTSLHGSGTVAGGGGNDSITIGAKDDGAWTVDLGNGEDTVRALGSGNDTINAGSGKDLIKLGAGKDDVTTSGDATVLGGSGAATIFGSKGTLDFVGGSGTALVRGGSLGSNTFEAGSGNETLTGASASSTLPDPKDTFTFLKGHAGGTDLINNFISGDVIKLEGYGPKEIARALDNAKYTSQGATITLSDNTKITFAGVTHLDPKSFTS